MKNKKSYVWDTIEEKVKEITITGKERGFFVGSSDVCYTDGKTYLRCQTCDEFVNKTKWADHCIQKHNGVLHNEKG